MRKLTQERIQGGKPLRGMARGRRSRGFTLLEVLISLGILTVGSTCVLALYSAAMETYRRSQVEFVATNLGMEVLNTAEDLLMHAHPLKTLKAEVDNRAPVPLPFESDLTFKEEDNHCVALTVRLMIQTRGKTHTWVWRRKVMRAVAHWILPLPERVPKRYRR